MKILSCFDGISCARVALERVGIPVKAYYASEVDKYAIQIAQKNYPDTVQLGNVKDIDCTGGKLHFGMGRLAETDIDLMIGGSPCQDLSIAKKDRKGLDGERSGLFWEYVRILKEVKPKYFILENVNSMPKEAKQIITETLGVEPIMINAALVSAQNRKRLFWTNIPNVTQPEDKGILLKDILENYVGDEYVINPKMMNYKGSNKKSVTITATSYKEPPKVIRIGQIGKGGQSGGVYSPGAKSVGLSALGGGRGAKTGLYAVALRNRGEGKKPEVGGGKANAMTTVQTDNMVMENSIIRKLTPIECERLQSLPDNYTEGVSNSQRYKMLGNAFNVDVVSHILSFLSPTAKN